MEPNGILWDKKEEAYYVGQKPELTRLVDTNKDGVCDRYETVTDEFGISGEYHEYHFGPVMRLPRPKICLAQPRCPWRIHRARRQALRQGRW